MRIPHHQHHLARREEDKSKTVTLDVLIVILVLAVIIVFPLYAPHRLHLCAHASVPSPYHPFLPAKEPWRMTRLYDRRRRHHGKSKLPQQRLRAQRKLDTIAQRRRVLHLAPGAKTETAEKEHSHDLSNDAHSLDETESLCPICLCALPSPEQPQALMPVDRPSVPFKARISFVLNAVAARRWDRKSAFADKDKEAEDFETAAEQDILALNTCKHSFHAACLISWFLPEKYDCPVCKGKYFGRRRLDRGGRLDIDQRRLLIPEWDIKEKIQPPPLLFFTSSRRSQSYVLQRPHLRGDQCDPWYTPGRKTN
jgi:hypothetical protein